MLESSSYPFVAYKEGERLGSFAVCQRLTVWSNGDGTIAGEHDRTHCEVQCCIHKPQPAHQIHKYLYSAHDAV